MFDWSYGYTYMLVYVSIDIYSVYIPYSLVGLLLHLGALGLPRSMQGMLLASAICVLPPVTSSSLYDARSLTGPPIGSCRGVFYGLGVCLLSWLCVVCFHSTYSPIFLQLCSFLTLSWAFC